MKLSARTRQRLLACLLIVGFFGGWEFLCAALNVSDLVLPRPSQIFATLWQRAPVLWPHMLQTLATTMAGFALGVVTGVVIGSLIGVSGVPPQTRPPPP